MSKPVVYVLDPYHADALRLLQETSIVKFIEPHDDRKSTWHEHATAVMLRSETRLSEEDFRKAKTLKPVVKQGVGVDNIEVQVHNTPALNSESVAELTIALALCVARRVCELDGPARRSEILVRSKVLGRSLFKKVIGVVGMGNIGKIVARKWIAAMEGTIVAFDPFASTDSWADTPHQRVGSLQELLSFRTLSRCTCH